VVRLDAEVERLQKKLGNEQFAAKASPDVVAKERTKLAGYEAERARAIEQLARLESAR
jgi:valyl-tRNA synthetase